jgi:hypothetical protein
MRISSQSCYSVPHWRAFDSGETGQQGTDIRSLTKRPRARETADLRMLRLADSYRH